MHLTHKPEPHKPFEIFLLPSGKTDVFLRRNEITETDEEENIIYTAEEVYFQSDEILTAEQVELDFERLWNEAENPTKEKSPEDLQAEEMGLLRAQNKALSERAEFVEELVYEIAMQVYQ